ncbi:hypothetical protein ACQP2U_15520 [Nocardia sp. CA-084685]|uniref:hypothetical protein n=1 Tax=Nocardia sp. CA-084685 TaxID=3239970 RepID=UPI003D955BC1
MNGGPQNWLYTSGDHQIIDLRKTPVVAYPFGRSSNPESPSSDNDNTGSPADRSRVSIEDPRVTHGRVRALAEAVTTDSGEKNELDAEPGRIEEPNPTEGPTVGVDNSPDDGVEPMLEAQAIAKVRKHLLSRNFDTNAGSPGRLVAERFSVGWIVGWIVYISALKRQRIDETYYVTDDGELEQTSPAVEPSTYVKSVEQRFWQRRALSGWAE